MFKSNLHNSDVSESDTTIETVKKWFVKYLEKFKGNQQRNFQDQISPHNAVQSAIFVVSCVLLALSAIHWYSPTVFVAENEMTAVMMLSGTFCTTGVMLDSHHSAHISQPRNVFGSYVVSSFLAVTTRIMCGDIGLPQWFTAAVTVAIAIVGMNITRTVHPPAGMLAMTAVLGGPCVTELGFNFVILSARASFAMVVFAVLVNNLLPNRQYPQYWW